LLSRAGMARPRRADGFTNGVGSISLRRGRRGREGVREASGRTSLCFTASKRRLERRALHGNRLSHRLHDPLPPLPSPLSAHRPWTTEREAQSMKFPLRSTIQIGRYVASQKKKGELYPLVLMLEPTLA